MKNPVAFDAECNGVMLGNIYLRLFHLIYLVSE